MKVFLDDLRFAPTEYDMVFRNAESFLKWLEENPDQEITKLSLDHDLGEGLMDGYDMVKKMVLLPNKIESIQFHTDNLVGLKNMYYYIKNARDNGLMVNLKTIRTHKVNTIDGVETVSPYKLFRIG